MIIRLTYRQIMPSLWDEKGMVRVTEQRFAGRVRTSLKANGSQLLN